MINMLKLGDWVMSSLAKRITRRTMILSMLSAAVIKHWNESRQGNEIGANENGTVLSGNWVLKKSDIS